MEHIAYLDNSSTTKPSRLAVEYINRALEYDWGNPSSLHGIGIQAETAMYEARETVAKSIGAEPGEIIFTGSGTESNNTALLTLLKSKKRGGRVITTAVEHPSVLETAKRLSEEGFEVIKLKPENNGVVALESLKAALTPNTVLVEHDACKQRDRRRDARKGIGGACQKNRSGCPFSLRRGSGLRQA